MVPRAAWPKMTFFDAKLVGFVSDALIYKPYSRRPTILARSGGDRPPPDLAKKSRNRAI